MTDLNFPDFQFKIQQQGQKKVIFDIARKKLIPLTPEEWIRQHALHVFTELFKIPISRIAMEREIKFGQLRKRFDIAVYDREGKTLCLVECKAPDVKISQETLLQIIVYNKTLDSHWLWITNGIEHFWFQKEGGSFLSVPFPNTL